MTILMPFGSLDGAMIHIMLKVINQRSHFLYTFEGFLSDIKKSFLLFQPFSLSNLECHLCCLFSSPSVFKNYKPGKSYDFIEMEL